jgi:hypothetical protein
MEILNVNETVSFNFLAQSSKRKAYSLQLIAVIFLCLFASPAAEGAEYYVDAVNGDDTNSGASGLPWQTLSKAQAKAISGDIVYLRSGNYGRFYESLATSRNDWITYKAETGHTPVFTQIYLRSSQSGVKRDTYLRFDGIDIKHPDWAPPEGDNGDYHGNDAGGPGNLFSITDCNYVQLLNGKYEGYYMWISRGGEITNSDNVTIRRCEITNFNSSGIIAGESNNLLIDNCYLHKMVNGSCLRTWGGVSNIVFQNNHINYETPTTYAIEDPYYPHNWETDHPDLLHNGSGFSIRSTGVVIRNNIVRGLFPQALMFYGNNGIVYHDMVVENNLFYDSGRIALYDCGDNITVRNNTFIGSINKEGIGKYDILQRYMGCDFMVYTANGYDGSGIRVYNNLFVNGWGAAEESPIQEDYNMMWLRGGTAGLEGSKGEHSITAVWREQVSPYALHGNPNFFEDIGFRGATSEYDYARDGVQKFLVNPGFYFGAIGDYRDKGRIWDYHLVSDSPAINFGASTVAAYDKLLIGEVVIPSQPPDSLGSLGADGFIMVNGPERNADHHSVGCYEYVSISSPALGDLSGDSALTAYDAALAARIAVGLDAYPTGDNLTKADVSGDKQVTAYDAALIAQRVVGLIDRFPVEE